MDFKDYEERSRNKFKKLFLDKRGIKNYSWSNLTDRHDCVFVKRGVIYIVELKERSDSYAYYNDLFLEYDKYQSLLELKAKLVAKGKTVKILYAHTFQSIDNLRFTVLNENYKKNDFTKQSHQRSQVFNNGNKTKYIKYISNNIIKNY